MTRIRVAFVDDSETLRALALDVFADAGMDVYALERETADVDAIAEWAPDVVVIDPQGGADATRAPFSVALAIANDYRLADVPVMLITDAWAMWQHEDALRLLQPARTVAKPFSVDEFVDAVRALARGRAEESA